MTLENGHLQHSCPSVPVKLFRKSDTYYSRQLQQNLQTCGSRGRVAHRHKNKVAQSLAVPPIFQHLQNGTESIGSYLETAHPAYYLIYLISAGFGLPCSEDALVVWVGSNIFKGKYQNLIGNLVTLGIVYVGVVISDMITFGIGVLFRLGFLSGLKKGLLRDSNSLTKASAMIQKWSKLIGLVQRFSLGFRGPLCLVCGFTGVSGKQFLGGVAFGALLTMPLQIVVGYILHDVSNVYLTALALASGPNLLGHVIGPIFTALGFWWAGRDPPKESSQLSTS